MDNVLHFLFGIFGNATALFLFLSPMVTFRRIVRSKSTEQFSGVPYNMTMLNCLLSAWYGLPFVSPNNLLVSTINGTGSVMEAVYVIVFLAYAPPKTQARMSALLGLVLSVFAAVALVSLLALHGNQRKLFCGFAAAIFSICMYASPLSIMRLVVKTKSVEYMPFLLSLFVFLCGTSWFVYGLLGRDPFVAVPNGVGSALGAVQLILYAIYRKGGEKEKGKKKTDGDDGSAEKCNGSTTKGDGSKKVGHRETELGVLAGGEMSGGAVKVQQGAAAPAPTSAADATVAEHRAGLTAEEMV